MVNRVKLAPSCNRFPTPQSSNVLTELLLKSNFLTMRQIETELQDKAFLAVPQEIAAQLPKSGHAKVILLIAEDAEDEEWQAAAYEQFMKEDSSEDSVYDKYA